MNSISSMKPIEKFSQKLLSNTKEVQNKCFLYCNFKMPKSGCRIMNRKHVPDQRAQYQEFSGQYLLPNF